MKNYKILVVEDNPEVLDIVALALDELKNDNISLKVETAADGFAALEKLGNNGPYDLLITDVNMPNLSGAELVDAIKMEPKFEPKPSIIVVSGNSSAVKINADDSVFTIDKPFQIDRFIKMVKMILLGKK